MKLSGERILYPCYFDAGLDRGSGRRIPRGLAVKGPTLQDLERALRREKIAFRAEEKHHPAHWLKREGRLIVTWTGPKEELLRRVARSLEQKK
ncbi:MAG TPA: signal recognition particle subunit SRP19/SEC65 family protein [Methanomicrobiales archaeon]|nr:signal recognition particle subunit SRP19/SEC65 family protein [Methanomicrobiales archaeon]